MNREADIITTLCGVFSDKYKPLSRAEFWKYYHQYEDNLEAMATSMEERIMELMQRSGSIAFGKEKLEQLGVKIVTIADEGFPQRLKEKLGKFCPPLFYTCGNASILQQKFVGYAGSRFIDKEDIEWTEKRLQKNLADGFGVVTGGAKGIDSVALEYAMKHDAPAVVFLADNLKEKLRDSFIQKCIWEGKLLIFSHISPLAPKTRNSFVSAAMERNKFIYALSNGTAVVRSDLDKGGTWSGATEALKHSWAQVFVWDNLKYPGNQKLIEMGAHALSSDGKRQEAMPASTLSYGQKILATADQLSLF